MSKKDKIFNLPRNRNLISEMSKMEIFRSAEVVSKGQDMGLSKRTVDSIVHSLVHEGLLIQARRGLYLTSEMTINKETLCRLARKSSKNDDAIISFDSALNLRNEDLTSGVSIMVSSGKIGLLETSIGDIRFFNVSKRLIDKVVSNFGASAVFDDNNTISHTPEMALALCCYLGTTAKSHFDLNIKDVNKENIDFNRSISIMKNLGIPEERYQGFISQRSVAESPSP